MAKRKWHDLDPTTLTIIAAIAAMMAFICVWRTF